ncbi:toxin-antitoxin system TumE family protein [Candidatus Methylospira mobilis]|uniref:toxin-antitoxin system TumE family protein n=1 Tax=Candidatus Methylospira mobilis TaxID=1808979 RepID=UPI00387EADD6
MYRLFYGYPESRIICYDNERPKGDHRHSDNIEELCLFESPEKLIDDFLREVESRRTKR